MNKNDPKIGQLIEEEVYGTQRDAIHFAIASVVAAENLYPSQDIGLCLDGTVAALNKEKLIGIVDPFLQAPVYKDQRFWMFLYPNTITSLQHFWTHPAFEKIASFYDSQSKEESKEWLEEFARSIRTPLEKILEGAKNWVEIGDLMIDRGNYEGLCAGKEFWGHYQTYTGVVVPVSDQENFFSCSC